MPRDGGPGLPGGGVPGGPPVPTGIVQLAGEEFDVLRSIGGVRGMVEAVLPTVLFTVVYTVRQDLRESIVAALALCVLLIGVRLVTRAPLMPAVNGLIGVGIGAGLALATGQAAAFFLSSIAKNAVFFVLYAGSALVGWPLLGVMLGFVLGEELNWRRVPARKRAYTLVTWLWAGMFALRLAVQVPLYLRGDVTALGAANVPLGLPLYAAVLGLTWLILRRVPRARPDTVAEGVADGPPIVAEADDGGLTPPATAHPPVARPVPGPATEG